MADQKISAMTNATALGGTDQLAGVQSGANVKITPQQIEVYIAGFASSGQFLVNSGGLVAGLTLAAVPNGGTGVNTLAAHGLLIGAGTGNIVVSGAGTTGQVLTSNGAAADPTFQAPVTSGRSAVTAVAGAASASTPNVIVTSEGLTAATSYTLTLTDALIASTSVIQCTPSDGGIAGVQIVSITPGSGSVVIVVGMAALTGTVKFNISIFN